MSHEHDDLPADDLPENAIAILGMAGRFPGARDLETFWRNLREGVEAIRTLSDEEQLAQGVLPATLAHPHYVRSGGFLEEIDLFDAPFFGYSAREAALLDPQQRLFLECAWEALEAAGYDSLRIDGPVGVYGGTSTNSYYLFYLFSRGDLLNSPSATQTFLGSDKDFLCTRISYELGLRGPSLGVQTACSTSLVAVHLACQSLLNGECDMALAGGASIRVPQTVGYFHQPGGILSLDGHCRSFDAKAGGSVPGSGVGVVVLKRLEDALADGDPIRAVIRGSAVNNDGALRVGFTAPSVEGQSAAIAEALALARIDPESIQYVEAHGSGTALGDPIEIAALTRAYRASTDAKGFCGVGSLKSSIGHLDAAAGIAGLIKTVLSLEHREIPPSLFFETPNPNIDFDGSPFYVNAALAPWESKGAPRRAGVSSFGMGGTNAHVVLEEAPEREPSGPSRPWQLLVLSAATPAALETATDRLAEHLGTTADDFSDIAWTLQAGRRVLPHRRALVVRDAEEARRALAERDPGRLLEGSGERTDRPAAFLLPGLGDQYPGMARGLYDSEPLFREEIDRCAAILRPLGIDLREALWPAGSAEREAGGVDLRAMLGRWGAGAAGSLERTALAQPALFAVEIALARLWREWGIQPRALIGYSLGEYVAACLAGVMSLEDALRIVALRARAIDALPAGAMLAVPLPEGEVEKLIATAAPSGGSLKPPSGGAATSPGIHARAGLPLAENGAPPERVGEVGRDGAASGGEIVRGEAVGGAAVHDEAVGGEALRGEAVGGAAVRGEGGTSSGAAAPPGHEYPGYVAAPPEGGFKQGLSLAAVNGPELCVVAGPVEAIERLEAVLVERGTPGRRLATAHAFHSPLLQPVAVELERLLRTVELGAPEIPYVSNVTGTWITAAEATDPAYWVRQMLSPVRFAEGLATLAEPGRVLLEVGPGQTLSSLALQSGGDGKPEVIALPSLRPAWDRRPDQAFSLATLGRLWLAGVPVDWTGFRGDEARRRVILPTYPFERKRYWIEVGIETPVEADASRGAVPGEVATAAAVSTTSHSRPGLATPYVAPSTPEEETLAGIWQELLGVSPVGVHDSFFDLGGHSLMATQLLARISARFGVELPLAVLFEAPTIQALAPRIAGGEAATAEPAIRRRPRADRAPLSFAQQRLWFVHRLSPENAAYNNPASLRLHGPLDVDVLTAALEEIQRRHEILRTTFPLEEGEPVQRIQEPGPVAIRRMGGTPTLEEAIRLVWAAVEEPFDLEAEPPVRHLLIRLNQDGGEDDHLFVTAMHHILWDEWSQGIFIRELAALYEAFRDGRPSPLPPLEIQYGDWALWQRETLQGEPLEVHLAYWRERLAGAPRLLSLPTDRPRPAVQTFRGATRTFAAAPELWRSLLDLSQRLGVTPFMTLMAGFQALLGRHSGQDDLVVGTGTGGRNRVEAESLIGCFINILLLRAELGGGIGFGDLLERTRDSTLGAFAHQDLPFELLVDALKVERDPSANPLAQVMLVFLNVPALELELPGLKVEGVRIDRQSAQFDLTFYLVEDQGRLRGHLEYNTDLFDASTIDRLLGHYGNLLERAAADPSRRLSEISLLSEAERRQAIVDWNATAVDFPREACLHELFEARAEEAPEAVGVVCGEQSLTYAELESRANQLAQHLLRIGARRGGRIGVSLERTPEVVVSLLAVLKAGCSYVPLDPDYPQERLAVMVESADVRLLVTQERLAGRFAGLVPDTVVVDGGAPAWRGERAERPSTGVSADDLVYVIFTSGSTGRPKGVMLDHRGRVSNFLDFNRRFGIGRGDAVLAVSSLSFDMSAYDILGTLAGGGKIVLPRQEELLEPGSWAGLMERHGVTVWHSVPAMLEMLVDRLEARPEAAPQALRVVLLGGDWIPVTLPDRLRALLPEALVVSLGGATEVSMDSTIFLIGDIDPAWKSIPYGVPMANQLAYVVGPDGGPSPVGVPGELLLGGIGVGQGYFQRPELTAEKFVPDPFSSEPGLRLYRTGDLARYRPDGVLELLGRMDHQVKIRGFRIELGEIAGALRGHPGVDDAVVLAREDRPGSRRLVAYLVPAPGAIVDAEEVRDFVRGRLPAYMVPSACVVMETLPLTPNRKLDRKALPAPEEVAEERERIAPRTALEKVLAGIWKHVLGVPEAGANDSFFDLGGHSLAATRVVTQIQDVFPLEIPLRTLFEAPTLAELATRLEAMGGRAGVDMAEMAEVILEVQELEEGEVEAALVAEETAS